MHGTQKIGKQTTSKKVSLKNAYIVHIADASDEKMEEMLDYILENRIEMIRYSNIDVSDVSVRWDMLAEFVFFNDADAMMFKLKFK